MREPRRRKGQAFFNSRGFGLDCNANVLYILLQQNVRN